MKTKILAFAAAATIASIANAGVLYWQVNDGATTKDVNGNTPSTEVQNDYDGWDYAALVWYANKIEDGDHANASGGEKIASVQPNISDTTVGGNITSKSDLDKWGAAAADIGSYSSGFFYVELINSSTGSDRAVGRSEDYLAFDDNGRLVVKGSGSEDFRSTWEFSVDTKIWNGGSSYVAVPEPTSGVMLLLGAAALGLRRKRRA